MTDGNVTVASQTPQFIVVGEAWTTELGGGEYKDKGVKGDTRQTSVPDYVTNVNSDGSPVGGGGEVRMTKRTIQQFLRYFTAVKTTYRVYRPISPIEASTMASLMITACNNPNIGYSQATSNADPDMNRTAIFRRGADTTVPINCDCSSLVSYCVSMATGYSVNSTSGVIGGVLDASNKFMPSFPARTYSFPNNPPFNGDVLVKEGHVAMVVAGNPREGRPDEVVDASWTGAMLVSYQNSYLQPVQFTPRTKSPIFDSDQYYNRKPPQDYGGNENGHYAWARFSEILGSECTLCRGVPRKWYVYNEDGYSRNSTPQLGAVMCFTNKFDVMNPGYVCVVEEINDSGIVTSQVNPEKKVFECTRREKVDGSWDIPGNNKLEELTFQGFIYNPAMASVGYSYAMNPMYYAGFGGISPFDEFMNIALSQVGNNGSFIDTILPGTTKQNTAWSGAFIRSVAYQSRVLNYLIPDTVSCSDIATIGVSRGMGTWHDGPSHGGTAVPRPGDIALFRTMNKALRAGEYVADRAGIVSEILTDEGSKVIGKNQTNSRPFRVIMGDCSGQVKLIKYTTTSQALLGFYRPRWELVDPAIDYKAQTYGLEGIYTEGTSIEDAAIRDLKYVKLTKNGFEPSIKSSGMLLCAINYTGMLANLYNLFSEIPSSNATDDDMVVDLWNVSTDSAFQNLASFDYSQIVPPVYESVSDPGIYTTVTQQGPTVQIGGSVDVKGTYKGEEIQRTITLTNTVKTIYDKINKEINNPAGTLGIMGAMVQLSNLDPANIDPITRGYGLLRWEDTITPYKATKRRQIMQQFCLTHGSKSEWSNNLSGQIQYMFYEVDLSEDLQTCIDAISRVTKDTNGAYEATRLFLDYFYFNGPTSRGTLDEVEMFTVCKSWTLGLFSLFFGGVSV